ncbi:hotdog domain-containing protein [Mycolicibacterium boenickei]
MQTQQLIDDLPPRGAEGRRHETVHRMRVTPVDVGNSGCVEGGTLLEWIDQAAYATAVQWCGRHCVAASVGNLHLDRPIGNGELLDLHAGLVYTGRSSMHILVTVRSSDPAGAKPDQTAQCPIIFIALDDAGTPTEVPPWTPVTMLELQRHRQARVRIRMRRRVETAMAAETYTAAGTAPQTDLRFRAGSSDIDRSGVVRAGRVMRWIDEAAYACGNAWADADVIPSYLAAVTFERPIFAGEVVDVTARLIHTGPRSIHTVIRVTTTDEAGGSCLVAQALIVLVTPGEGGAARAVPAWKPVSDEALRLDRLAHQLIGLRQFIEPFTIAAARPD